MRLGGGTGERVRARGAREVVEAEAKRDGASGPSGGPHSTRHAVDQTDERSIDDLVRLPAPAQRAL